MRGWITFLGGVALLVGLTSAALVGATLWGQTHNTDLIAFLGEQDNNYEIYLLDPTTGVTLNLTRDPLQDVSFTWSPDGREMAFVSKRSGRDTLYIMDAQGQNVRRIDTDIAPFAPVWSPDGQWLAFMSNPTNGLADIFVMPAAGGTPINITNTRDLSEASIAWSPDSTEIATAALNPAVIKLFSRDGTQVERIADNGVLPQFSPDGTQMAYRMIRGMPEVRIRDLRTAEEQILALDGSSAFAPEGTAMSLNTAAWVAPVWSADGTQMAFVTQRANANFIRVAHLETDEGRDYTTNLYGIGSLSWNTEGTRLVFAAKESPNVTTQNIYILDVVSGSLRRLTTAPAFTSLPAWQPR